MDRLGSISAFVQAAENRSFTSAGRKLGISSSAVGKAVSRLESRVGVRLFHRSTRTIALTAEGMVFLERCRRILAEVEAAEAELAQSQGAPRGKLRVSLPIISAVMMPAITGFMRAYPDIELDLDFTDRLVDLVEEGLDVVVRAGEVTDSRLMSRLLGRFKLMLVASPGYLSQRGVPRNPEDLSGHACLLHRFATSGKFEPWPLWRRGTRLELDLRPAAIVNTIEPLVTMAEQGLGIACLPDMGIRPQLKDGRLVPVLTEYVVHAGPMRLLWPASRHPAPKLRVFIDFMANWVPAPRDRSTPDCQQCAASSDVLMC